MSNRYHLWVSGCQMNGSDARRLADVLDSAGMSAAENFEDAGVAILYTCSVRQSAEDRVHGQLGHLKSLKARHPDLMLCVTGCMAGVDQAELRERYPFVDLFVAPTEMESLPRLILGSTANRDACAPTSRSHGPRVPVSVGVTVIRGCDKFCSYCIVPYRRGQQRSRPEQEILEEVSSLLARGAKEIVLLGQTVDAWGRDLDPPRGLASLLREVAALPGLARLRFLTSHPNDFTPDLIEAIADVPRLCEELNLPIQAGDDEILRRMARRYTVSQYTDLVARIRATIPDIALSTDVIVGFPGETVEQFEHTLDVLRQVEFDVVHVAAYSPRPGTAAARKMVDDVPAPEKLRRLHQIEELQTALSTRKNNRLIGQEVELLVEGRQKGKWRGRTRSNKLLFLESDLNLRGELVTAVVEAAGPWSLRGRLETSAAGPLSTGSPGSR